FAYRQPSWAAPLTIVEVDQPGSQKDKRSALARAGIAVPPNVRYADVDFERETLAAGLARSRVAMNERAFFSWLRGTVCPTLDAIEAVLRTVAAFPTRSAIVLTFAQPPGDGDTSSIELAQAAAALGEPWLSYFTPAEIDALLRQTGYSSVRFLERDEAERRY